MEKDYVSRFLFPLLFRPVEDKFIANGIALAAYPHCFFFPSFAA